MYYNRILRVWVVDPVDYFLLSAIIGSFTASWLKNYLSEKKAMERLKNSIIKKSKIVIKLDRPILNSSDMKVKTIYRLALETYGGQFEEFPIDYNNSDHQFSNEILKLAQEIKGFVEKLAVFLKERELKGVARIFFKNGRLLLELILYKCRIDITYSVLTEGLSTQVIIITATAGGAAGFTLSWFSAGAILVAPPVLISTLLIRSVLQQIINLRDYSKFKKLVNKMLEDEELKKTIRAFFIDGEVPPTNRLEMKPFDFSENSIPKYDVESGQTLAKFIKARMKEELGLVENPTPEQLQEIIHRKKSRGKVVFWKDFIRGIDDDLNTTISDDIIDIQIIDPPIVVKVRNEEF